MTASLCFRALLVAAALGAIGCGSSDCPRLARSADAAAKETAAGALELDVPWVEVGDELKSKAKDRTKVYRKAAAKASFSGAIVGPQAELGRELSNAYRGVAQGLEIWIEAVESVAGKKDGAIKKARAALALVGAYNAVCVTERPADLPEPPPVPYGVPQKLNFLPCAKIDTAGVEGAVKSGKGLELALSALEEALKSVPSEVEKPKDYTDEPLAALRDRASKAQEAAVAVAEAKAAAADVEATAAALEEGAATVKKSLDETKRLHGEVQSSCGL